MNWMRWLFVDHTAVLLAVLWVQTTERLHADDTESRAYEVAVRMYRGGTFDLAEKELAEFAKNYPKSEKVPNVILLEAQCQYRQKKYDQALTLLRATPSGVGKLADEYLYWTAECLFEKEDYTGAAALFGKVINDFPDSGRRLGASIGEAYARFRQGDLKGTAELLGSPRGVFQLAAAKRPDDELVIRGQLLLAEAYLGLEEFPQGEEVLKQLGNRKLRPDLSWQEEYVLARLQLAARRLDDALQTTTNLLAQLATVTNAVSVHVRADADALQGQIQELRNQPQAAIQAYERNLDTNAPVARRQQALQQIVRLAIAQNKLGEAGKRLEAYVLRNPADSTLDLLRLTLGELRLKEYYAQPQESRDAATNLLQQARAQFDRIIANTNAQFTAQAQLDQGWCLWGEMQDGGATNALPDSLLAFQSAAELLPHSKDQAVARFKLADCLFELANYVGAITNYWLVVTNYADVSEVKNGLASHALYQIVRAGVQQGDMINAERAVRKILAMPSSSDFSDRSVLLYGQALEHSSSPAQAREFFEDFAKRFSESTLLPEVELAITRTYEREGNWKEAASRYDRWVVKHPDHRSRPEAEFNRAWAEDLAGDETNAFTIFTNFMTQFPTGALAPLAQYWVGAYYFGRADYEKAELNFQNVYQNTNWPQTDISFEAWTMAGRAAYEREGYNDAANYFLSLIDHLLKSKPDSPLLLKAYFALADTYIRSPQTAPGSTNALDGFKGAIGLLDKITREHPTDALAPLAWARLGDCYSQLATSDAKLYERAVSAYKTAMNSDLADIKCRSIAEIGLASVLESEARKAEKLSTGERTSLFSEALKHYLYVVDGKNLRDREVANPFYLKEAAVSAARLAEEEGRWDVAADLYERLLSLLPPLRKTWEAKLEKLVQLRSQEN